MKGFSKNSFCFLIVIGIIIFSCNENHSKPNVNVLIKKSTDTVSVGDVFEANLFLNYKDSICHADFYIVQNGDTFLLDYNPDERHAIFRAITRSVGEMKYAGFAIFDNEEGVPESDDFCIEFYSK
jgi:hypothetical protein